MDSAIEAPDGAAICCIPAPATVRISIRGPPSNSCFPAKFILIFRTRPRNSLSGPPSDAHRVRGNGCHGMSFVSLTREILIDFHTAAYEQSTWNSLGFPRGSLSTTEIARTRLILWKAEQLARHVAKLITCSLSRHTFCSFC